MSREIRRDEPKQDVLDDTPAARRLIQHARAVAAGQEKLAEPARIQMQWAIGREIDDERDLATSFLGAAGAAV